MVMWMEWDRWGEGIRSVVMGQDVICVYDINLR